MCPNTSATDNRSFSQLPLHNALLSNITSLGYENMTPIQEQSLPLMLNGDDVIAQAKTGSGKTAAFGLALLNAMNLKLFAVQALILYPTRELAEQVSQAIRTLARQMPNVKIITLSGGMPMKPQLDSLKHGTHIVVGTPGRVQKHLDKETLKIDKLTMLVLDEADRMLDMGFLDAMRAIVKLCPKKRQTLLFSATFPPEIKRLSIEFMNNPKEIVIKQAQAEQHITQLFYDVTKTDKFGVLTALLKQYKPTSTLIFCNTKLSTMEVTRLLKDEGFSAVALNGDLDQVDRDLAIIKFSNQSCSILVATDVAARGLDIQELPLVINYELAYERDTHTHRIGRTGRAGNKGVAISLTTLSDAHRVCAIEDTHSVPLVWGNITKLSPSRETPPLPNIVTLCLDIGKKDKIRPGDIVGALTKEESLPFGVIGKINVLPLKSYVAINKSHASRACQILQTGTLKGRRVLVKKLD